MTSDRPSIIEFEEDGQLLGLSISPAQRTLWRAKAELGIITDRGRTSDGKGAAWYWMLPAKADR